MAIELVVKRLAVDSSVTASELMFMVGPVFPGTCAPLFTSGTDRPPKHCLPLDDGGGGRTRTDGTVAVPRTCRLRENMKRRPFGRRFHMYRQQLRQLRQITVTGQIDYFLFLPAALRMLSSCIGRVIPSFSSCLRTILIRYGFGNVA